MEDQIRKIVREEIARALSAAGSLAENIYNDASADSPEEIPAYMLMRLAERVARDVLANQHPEIPGHAVREDEHAASTEPVHTITAVPERPKATCTCHRHTHVMGHGDRCGAAFCYCLSPVRARGDHPEHTGTETLDYNRPCTVCEHGEHDQGKCGMHVYLRGVASPCPCLASRTLGAQASTREEIRPLCSYCNHSHPGRLADCNVMVGKQLCPCPFTGGRS